MAKKHSTGERRARRRYNALAKATHLLLRRALMFWQSDPAPSERPVGFDEVGSLGMRLPAITVTRAQLRRALRDLIDLEKSRQRVCPQGLVSRWVITKRGYKMSVCVNPDKEGAEPLHSAKTEHEGLPHLMKVGTPNGPVFLATHGVPGKSSQGDKLEYIRHPLQYLDDDDVHAVDKDPESEVLGHSNEQAYHHAMRNHILRGAGGEIYGMLQVSRRDPHGEPTEWTLYRSKENQFANRLASRRGGDQPANRGQGIPLRAAELSYLREHPPTTGPLEGPDGRAFAYYSRLALPVLDADGRPIAGRPPRVRYEVRFDPSIYGGAEAFKKLKMMPGWRKTLDEPKADARFRRFVETAKRRLFAREADRPSSGSVAELLEKHGDSVEALLRSGDLGHLTVPMQAGGKVRVKRVSPRKPLSERDTLFLVSKWKQENPGLVETLKNQARARYPLLNDEAAMDNAIDDGITAAIHGFDPSLKSAFNWYVVHTTRGHLYRAAHARGEEHGAEQLVAGPRPGKGARRGPDSSEDDEREEPSHEAGDDASEEEKDEPETDLDPDAEPATPRARPPSRKKSKADADKPFQEHGSQVEFGKILEQVLPGDARARTAISALYPTGDLGAGAHYRRAEAETGIPLQDLLGYGAQIARVKRDAAYQRYFDRRLKSADPAREAALSRGQPTGPLKKRRSRHTPSLAETLRAIGEELRIAELKARLKGHDPLPPEDNP